MSRGRRARSSTLCPYEEGYAPERDFYGPLRKRIVQTFEEGWDPKRLDELLTEVDDPKKQYLYTACRKSLRKWAGGLDPTPALSLS